jgi:hypothetical protein
MASVTDRTTTTVLFIGGIGRSGSTLLEQALAGVPGVLALGEVVHLWQRGIRDDENCACGQPFSRCTFWQEVGERAFGGWQRVDVADVHRLRDRVDHVRKVPSMARPSMSSAVRRDRDAYADYYRRVYRAAAEVSGADVVVDSSKQASMPHVLAGQRGIDLRLLHCVRDARAVCYAWTKTVERPDRAGQTVYMDRYPERDMAMMWSAHNAAMDLARRWDVPQSRIRYEDMVRDPRGVVRQGLESVGVAVLADSLAHIGAGSLRMSETHTVAGNPMRFQTGVVEVRSDDEWQQRMPAGRRRVVTAMTWPLLARYGYLRASR